MMKWIKALFYLTFLYTGLSLASSMNGIHLDYLFNPGALLFVLSGYVFILASYSFSEVFQAFAQATLSHPAAESSHLSQNILRSMGNYGLMTAGISVVLGAVNALANLDDVSQLGAALAVSLMPLLWAVAIKFFVLVPLQNNVHQEI